MNDLALAPFPIDGVVFCWGMTTYGEKYENHLNDIN
jgi:hypothetical protein